MDDAQLDQMIKSMFWGMAELRASQAATSKQIQAMQKAQAEAGKKIKEVSRQLGSIGLNMGDFAEDLFYSSLKEHPVLGGG